MVALLAQLVLQSADRLEASVAGQNPGVLDMPQELLSLAPAKKRTWRFLVVTTPSLQSPKRDPWHLSKAMAFTEGGPSELEILEAGCFSLIS